MPITIFKYATLTSLTAFMVVVNGLTTYASTVVEPVAEASEEKFHLSAVERYAEAGTTETEMIFSDAVISNDAGEVGSITLNPFDKAIEEMNWADSWTDAPDALDAPEIAHSLNGVELNSDSMAANEPIATELIVAESIATEASDVALLPTLLPTNSAALNQGDSGDVVAAVPIASEATEEIQPYSTNALDLTQPIAQTQPSPAQPSPAHSVSVVSEEPTDIPATDIPATEANSETAALETETPIAQVLSPGQPTRSGPSYIGAGGNIGFGGSTGIGRGNFALFSKLGLTNNFSLRPAAFIGDRTTFLVPVTLDFPTGALIDDAVPFSIAPYAGGGIGVSTGDDSRVRPVIVAGVDAPVSSQFTATAGVTVGFFRNTEVGLLLGIGYNFGGF
jgi:hypothetical protein